MRDKEKDNKWIEAVAGNYSLVIIDTERTGNEPQNTRSGTRHTGQFSRGVFDSAREDASITFACVIDEISGAGIPQQSVQYIRAKRRPNADGKAFSKSVDDQIQMKLLSGLRSKHCIVVGDIPLKDFKAKLKQALSPSPVSSPSSSRSHSPSSAELPYKRQLQPYWGGLSKDEHDPVCSGLNNFFELKFKFTDLASEIAVYQTALDITKIEHYNKIYDLSCLSNEIAIYQKALLSTRLEYYRENCDWSVLSEYEAKNAEAVKEILKRHVTSDRSIFYLSKSTQYEYKSLVQLIAEAKGAPCLILVDADGQFPEFATLKREWEKNYTFFEKWTRFFKALTHKISFGMLFNPSNILIIAFLLVSINLLLYHFWSLIFAQAGHALMLSVLVSLAIFIPLAVIATYKDYQACKKSYLTPPLAEEAEQPSANASYGLLAYLADFKPRLKQWSATHQVESGIWLISGLTFLFALLLTIGFFTGGFGLFSDAFCFLEPLFTFLRTVLFAGFSFEFLTPEAGMLLATIAAGIFFVAAPFALVILGRRIFATVEALDEVVDATVDPYYDDVQRELEVWSADQGINQGIGSKAPFSDNKPSKNKKEISNGDEPSAKTNVSSSVVVGKT